jgi:hypothetical protein
MAQISSFIAPIYLWKSLYQARQVSGHVYNFAAVFTILNTCQLALVTIITCYATICTISANSLTYRAIACITLVFTIKTRRTNITFCKENTDTQCARKKKEKHYCFCYCFFSQIVFGMKLLTNQSCFNLSFGLRIVYK